MTNIFLNRFQVKDKDLAAKGCSIEEARNEFPERLFSDSAIVSSALRLAELEMYHRPVSSVWREIK